jgi:hypothetical protein
MSSWLPWQVGFSNLSIVMTPLLLCIENECTDSLFPSIISSNQWSTPQKIHEVSQRLSWCRSKSVVVSWGSDGPGAIRGCSRLPYALCINCLELSILECNRFHFRRACHTNCLSVAMYNKSYNSQIVRNRRFHQGNGEARVWQGWVRK